MDADLRLLTSIRLEAGQCGLLTFHLDRLAADAAALGFTLDREELAGEILRRTAQDPVLQIAALRVLLDRQGTWFVEGPQPVPEDPAPLEALLWSEVVSSRDPLLGHRTTPRPVYDAAYATAREAGFVDVLFQNELGMVTEGAINNIFVRQGDQWRTPPLRAGVLPGVYRRHLLETRPEIEEADVSVAELLAADEVWLSCALHGLRRLTAVRSAQDAGVV